MQFRMAIMKSSSFFVLCALLFLGSGCAGKIAGVIYLDSNKNNIQDLGEAGLKGVVFTLIRDGEAVTSGVTTDKGYFEVANDKAGDVCIQVKENSKRVTLTQTGTATGGEFAGKSSIGKGMFDESSSTTMESTQENSDATPQGSSTSSDSGSAGSTQSTPRKDPRPPAVPYKACDNSQSFSITDLKVPITVDYKGGRYPEQATISVQPGESFFWDRYYPASCQVLPFILNGKYFERKSMQKNSSFNASIVPETKSIQSPIAVPSFSVNEDNISYHKVTVYTKEEVPQEKQCFDFKAQALCPDDSIIDLPSQEVCVEWKECDVRLSVSGESVNAEWGEEMGGIVLVKNRSSRLCKDFDLDVMLPRYGHFEEDGDVMVEKGDAECSQEGAKVHCQFDLEEEGEMEVHFGFQFGEEPPNLTETQIIHMEATLSSPDLKKNLTDEMKWELPVHYQEER